MKNPAAACVKPKPNMNGCAVSPHGNAAKVGWRQGGFPFRDLLPGGFNNPGQAQRFNAFKKWKVNPAPGGKDEAKQAPTIKGFGTGRAGNPRLANQAPAKSYIFGNHSGGKREES
jgi:hypothetical protein